MRCATAALSKREEANQGKKNMIAIADQFCKQQQISGGWSYIISLIDKGRNFHQKFADSSIKNTLKMFRWSCFL